MDNEDKPTKKKRAGFSSTKEGGYMSQKRYRESHRGIYYEPKIRIPAAKEPVLKKLLADTGLSITELCLTAIEEKYGVDLRKPIDK